MYGRKAEITVGDAGSSSGRIACYLLLSKWFDNIRWSDIGKLAGQTAVCDSPSPSKLVERSDIYIYGDRSDCVDRHCNIPYGLLSQPTGRCGVWIGAVGGYQTDPENVNE